MDGAEKVTARLWLCCCCQHLLAGETVWRWRRVEQWIGSVSHLCRTFQRLTVDMLEGSAAARVAGDE